MNRHLFLLAIAQGLFLTNNVTFIAINGLVGLNLAPFGWMATLPVMGYVVGGAISSGLAARLQQKMGRKKSFQLGLLVALASCLWSAFAVMNGWFIGLILGTIFAGYYNANAQLYRFAAAELCTTDYREKGVSLVMAGGLIGAVVGPNLARISRDWLNVPFVGAYLALAAIALFSLAVVQGIEFPKTPTESSLASGGRSLVQIMREPKFAVAVLAAAMGYGVMNLLMAATPLAMQVCGLSFSDTAFVLEWHVIGMFAPGFFTGHLIKRFGVLRVMGAGVLLMMFCIVIALLGRNLQEFWGALFLLGVGWNFLFTGSTTLAMTAYLPEEKNRAQGAVNFFVFATMALSSFSSGAIVNTQGWSFLNLASIVPVTLTGLGLLWLAWRRSSGSSV